MMEKKEEKERKAGKNLAVRLLYLVEKYRHVGSQARSGDESFPQEDGIDNASIIAFQRGSGSTSLDMSMMGTARELRRGRQSP